MNAMYESAKSMQTAFPLPGASAEDRLLDLLAYSIIDIPMVQRRKEVARRVAHTLAGYLRDQMIPMQVGVERVQYTDDNEAVVTNETMIPLSKISTLLKFLDGAG